MLSELLTVGSGDAIQLTYIRNRYNTLLLRKEEFEQQIKLGRHTFKNIGLLLEIQTELLQLDDTRTAFVNRRQLEVPVGNIKVVSRKPKYDYYNLLLENKTPGAYKGRDKKHRIVKQQLSKGKYKQKLPLTI